MNLKMRLLAVSCLLLLVAQAAAGCEGWDTQEFFKSTALEEVTACLEAGAWANARSESGWIPLHRAAGFSTDPAIVTVLLEAGAEVNDRDEDGNTPLHVAAVLNPNPAVITALVEAGAEVDARNEDGRTPLHWAARFSDNPAVITALLDAGADTTALDAYGRSPWNYARGREGLEGTDALLRLYEGRPR